MHNMNEAQLKAVMHGEGPMLVLAGPGSGKTFTITRRISYLIEHYGVEPSRILVITFTKDAAINMQRRFHGQCTTGLPVNFGTFHAIFYQMIKQSGYYRADSILTDSEKKQLCIPLLIQYKKSLDRSTNGIVSGATEVTEDDVRRCLSAISYYKNTGNADKAEKMLDKPYRTGFQTLLSQYEKQRALSGKLDFDDMLYLCLKMLKENSQHLQFWQGRFEYLLIDEFQDINPIQYEIIRLIAAPRNNVFAVGDDDQSIYGFRGSEPALMKKFTKDYRGCRQVLLDINYRSTSDIVKASLKVIRENKKRFTKELKAYECSSDLKSTLKSGLLRNTEKSVSIKSFSDKVEQYKQMGAIFGAIPVQELEHNAVLFRTNLQMQQFAAMLLRHSIPYVMKEKGMCIYDHFIMKDIKAYMLFACGDCSRSNFLAIMNKPQRYIGREALTEETVKLNELRKYYETYALSNRHQDISGKLAKLERDLWKLKKYQPHLGLVYLRKAVGYDAYLEKKSGGDETKRKEWMELLEQLTEEAKDFTSYEGWFKQQDKWKEQYKKQAKTEEKGVRLMTVHGSKGLEFDSVWIPDINEGTFPYGRMLSEETVEEERRIFYVAMTRAKKNLELSFVTGTKERPRSPSRFLNPLMKREDYSSSTSSSNSQLSKYSSKASDTRSYSSSSSI